MQINFNNSFNLEAALDIYRQDRRGRFTDVLATENATAIHSDLKALDYDLALIHENQYMSISPQEWAQFDQQTKQHYIVKSNNYASRGEGFIYGRKDLSAAKCGVQTLDELTQWLNSEAVLSWVRKLSGYEDIVAASAQATRYVPGQFLTRHKDVHHSEQRRVAYVLNFTESWHPDWGGLLQFYESNGTPRDSWAPGFNALSLFDVEHVHGVTYITPFALNPRLSVTGWFRATPV